MTVDTAFAAAPNKNASWLGKPTATVETISDCGLIPPATPPPLTPRSNAGGNPMAGGGGAWRCGTARLGLIPLNLACRLVLLVVASCLSASYTTNWMMGLETRTSEGAAPDHRPDRPSSLYHSFVVIEEHDDNNGRQGQQQQQQQRPQ